MVCTSDDADATLFPLNTPVLLTDVLAASGKAGETGTLAHSLDAISDQTKPLTVVVRVAQGETEAETTAFATARTLGLRAKIDNDTGWQETLLRAFAPKCANSKPWVTSLMAIAGMTKA